MRATAVRPPAVLLLVSSLLGVSLLAALLAGGCAGTTASPTGDAGAAPSARAATSAASATAGTGAPGQFNGTDIAWLQLMIALDERALPLLELVPDQTPEPAVRQLAARVGDSHRAELDSLRALLERSGAPKSNPHEGHDMPGMVTAAELRAMGQATDATFRRLFGQSLRKHLEQSARISRSAQDAGADPETKLLAGTIVRNSTSHLDQLGKLGQLTG